MTDDLALSLRWLAQERGLTLGRVSPDRALLDSLLISRAALALPDDVDLALHRIFTAESAQRAVTQPEDIQRWQDSAISLWQGDITTLAADVIVNAANDQMLGCFIPQHRCIDNAIHRLAGPWLRAECAEMMDAKGHREPTGSAELTGAHYLPSRYIAHTVGPIVGGAQPTQKQREELASCYRSCLDRAEEAGAKSIAFCAISTGVFGYPIALAAAVAIETVRGWLAARPDSQLHVIFNTFSDSDTEVYRAQLQEW